MFDQIPSIKLASLALDALAERQKVLANNLANVNTPGFIPLTLNFESQLRSARDVLSMRPGADVKAGFAPELVESSATAVALDEQLAAMSENGLQYQTLTRAINKQLAILSIAVTDGRR